MFHITSVIAVRNLKQCHWSTDWMNGGSRHGRGWEFFSSPPRLDRLWGPSSLLSNEYQGRVSWCKAAGAWNRQISSF